MRKVSKMYNIYNVLFTSDRLQAALKLEDGKEKVKEVFVSIDENDLEWLELYGGYASIENLTCSVFKTLEQAEEDAEEYNN